ncbi:MAG: AAA family ATPase, partial [Bacteroidota bacterium]
MIKSKRKILIAILGCPAVGKSFLIRKIKEEINPDVIQEFSRNSLPRKIKCNLEDRKNLFETLLWFRNLQISNHLEACKKEKDITIIDTPFYQYK